MSLSKRLLFSAVAGAGTVLTLASAAHAAEAANPNQLEEVVVTARRTGESLQTTPVAVTAITAQAMAQRQQLTVADLQRATPNLSFGGAGTGPASIVYLAIRGNAQNSPNSASDAAVGIYVDGVYYGRPIIGNLGLMDLESVEVLRGPQGTLFGRNTTGGALNLTTKRPTGAFEGYVRGGLGNYDSRVAEAVVNVPLQGEQLAVRLAARYDERSGYGSNPINGRDLANINAETFGRATVRFAPESLPLVLTVAADYTRYRDDGTMTALAVVNPKGPLATLYPGAYSPTYINTSGNFYKSYGVPHSGDPEIDNAVNRNDAKGISANLELNLGEVKLKSISAYRKSTTANAVDLDGTPADVGAFFSEYKQHQWSQEFQLTGSFDKLDWIAGLYYFDEKGTERSDSFILTGATLGPNFRANLQPSNRNFADFKATSKGAFLQGNYHLTDRLRATAGFRYTWDDRKIVRHGRQNISGVPEVVLNTATFSFNVIQPLTCTSGPGAGQVNPPGGCNEPRAAKFKYPAWIFSLDYELADKMFVYAKTSAAAMAGGFNTRPVPPGADSFRPEKVKDVELGFKGDFLESRLRTNAVVFYNWRNGVQNIVNEFTPGRGLTQYVRNAGDVRAYGVEFEGTLLPWEGMELESSLAYLHSKYASGSFVIAGAGGPLDRSGERVQQAPKWTASLGGTQALDMPWGKLSLHADYSYVASRAFYQDTPDTTNPALTPAARAALLADFAVANRYGVLKGYGLLNARVAATFDKSKVEVAVFGRNLTQEHYFLNEFNSYANGLGFVEEYQGSPRTYGVSVTYNW
ncbi:MAG: tonB dependent receptor family protein [Phenylobacterium sp.]|nr:tonB dependent receptor family protein [Phenylobacterium sp.]